ncbi:MAG: hypothetical protein AAF378_15080 [Cyanobacteria bacterium P01_A01_bin.84]
MFKNKFFLQPLDRVSLPVILALIVAIAIVIAKGDIAIAEVRQFTWQHQYSQDKDINIKANKKTKISADYTSFSLSFTRPMDIKSVENNLKIEPPLAGKFSWAGSQMFYTLLTPVPYGTEYKLELKGARDRFAAKNNNNQTIEDFTTSFQTRDRVILYIGAEKEAKGRLVLYNFTQGKKEILTPADLTVEDFEAFPNGEKILFSAHSAKTQDLLSAKIYTVTTGISASNSTQAQPSKKIELILGNENYQNLKFDLSPDGKKIVIQRASKVDTKDITSDFGLWFMSVDDIGRNSGKPKLQKIQTQPGGDFTITPDSQAVAIAQGQGTAIVPLKADGGKPLDYFPNFGVVKAFSKDGSQAAMVKFNTDYTRDLFLVTTQGEQKQLLKTTGSIIKCEFDNASPSIYCLLSQLLPGELYQEQPYLVIINLKTGQQKPLVVFPPEQRNLQMSLSNDGLGLLFDQTTPDESDASEDQKSVKTTQGDDLSNSSLWLMPLLPIIETEEFKAQPERLPLTGFHPRWLP